MEEQGTSLPPDADGYKKLSSELSSLRQKLETSLQAVEKDRADVQSQLDIIALHVGLVGFESRVYSSSPMSLRSASSPPMLNNVMRWRTSTASSRILLPHNSDDATDST